MSYDTDRKTRRGSERGMSQMRHFVEAALPGVNALQPQPRCWKWL